MTEVDPSLRDPREAVVTSHVDPSRLDPRGIVVTSHVDPLLGDLREAFA